MVPSMVKVGDHDVVGATAVEVTVDTGAALLREDGRP
jgi:hypothetical protein